VYGSNFGDPERKPSLLGKLSKLPAPRLHWLEPRQSPPVLEPQSWSCPDKLQPSTPTSAHHVTPHSPAIEVQAALRGLSLFHTHTHTHPMVTGWKTKSMPEVMQMNTQERLKFNVNLTSYK